MIQIHCNYCKNKNIVKKGIRINKTNKKQMYFCKDCKKVFTENTSENKQTSADIILTSIINYCQNKTLEEIKKIIKQKYKTNISTSGIHKWIQEHNPKYLQIKKKLAKKYPKIIESKRFYHSGQIYNYKYHIPKLKEFTKYPTLISYLENIHKFIDNKKFNNSKRCSKLKLKTNKQITKSTRQINKLIKKALPLAKTNKKRHKVIEDYLLNCDRDTIAAEVPIYYHDKKIGNISGHIDIIQIKQTKTLFKTKQTIHILNYKPNANKENIEKVTTQLNTYAIALSFRTKIPIRYIRCAYFDEQDYYEFRPKYNLSTPTTISKQV